MRWSGPWADYLARELINSERPADVRFGADNGLKPDMAPCPKSANSGSEHFRWAPQMITQFEARETFTAQRLIRRISWDPFPSI
jgi:hypothetical protein